MTLHLRDLSTTSEEASEYLEEYCKIRGVVNNGNFYWYEIACRDKDGSLPPEDLLVNVSNSVLMMEQVRTIFGDVPVTVNSWYRTPEYNKQCGGKPNSWHMKAAAVDFTVQGFTPAQVQKRLIKLQADGEFKYGIGTYSRFTHVDLGKTRVFVGDVKR